MKHLNVTINDEAAQALTEIKKRFRLGNDAAVSKCILAAHEFLFKGEKSEVKPTI